MLDIGTTETWESVHAHFRSSVGEEVYASGFHTMVFNRQSSAVDVSVPHQHLMKRLKSFYASQLQASIQVAHPDVTSVVITVRNGAAPPAQQARRAADVFVSEPPRPPVATRPPRMNEVSAFTSEDWHAWIRSHIAPSAETVTLKRIIRETCTYFNISEDDLKRKNPKKSSFPRHLVMYLARRHTRLSYPQIALGLGLEDHSSILYGDRRIAELRTYGMYINMHAEKVYVPKVINDLEKLLNA